MLAAVSRNAAKANIMSKSHLLFRLPRQMHQQEFPIGP
jgi:hypothetical protein